MKDDFIEEDFAPGGSQRDPGLVDRNGNRHCYECGRFLPSTGIHFCPTRKP